MSVVAMIVKPDEYALIAADGVATDPVSGTVCGTMSKVIAFPHISAVMGITGLGGFTHLMQWFVPPHVSTFDEMIEVLPELVEFTWNFIQDRAIAAHGMFNCCIVVGGWSESRQQFEGWRVVTYPKESIMANGETRILEPFVAHPMPNDGRMWSSTNPGTDTLKRFGVIDGPEDQSDVDAIIRAICAARTESGRVSTEGVNFNAGGFVEVALMHRHHVQSWIAHVWPEDVAGEPIDPTRGQPMPDHLMAHYHASA